MAQNTTLPKALLVVGIALLIAPALFPIQPVLVHDTRQDSVENASRIREQGYTIVTYENMSERGQQLYVQTLRSGGEYSVPMGEGATEFSYPTSGELDEVEDYRDRIALQGIAIERPANNDLPPPDEPIHAAEHVKERYERNNLTAPSEEEIRRQIGRYDLMTTRTASPPLEEPTSLARLVAAGLGVLALGIGGYLQSKPR